MQLIDTLKVGGAEQMAVSFANALNQTVEYSALVPTRHEGNLKRNIDKNVSYMHLDRKSTFDIGALIRLRKFIKTKEIEIVHAHGTSFFIAFLIKLTLPKMRIIYHEHFGGRKNETFFDNIILVFASFFFDEIIVVNQELERWCKKVLFCKKVYFLPNFQTLEKVENKKTVLKRTAGKRIVFLANLKKPKNHLLVLQAFLKSKLIDQGWSLHLVGKIYNDNYSRNLQDFISINKLENTVFLYDVCYDIRHILKQATIGILASTDEGFPVTILEYSQAKLMVIASNVGYCSQMIKHNSNGLLFDPNSITDLILKLDSIGSKILDISNMGEQLFDYCQLNFNQKKVIDGLLKIYKKTV